MKLHMVDVVGQYNKIKSDVDAAIHKILDSGQFILGKEVGEFECQIAGYLCAICRSNTVATSASSPLASFTLRAGTLR